MAFNDCSVTEDGALDLPREKFERMVEQGHLCWIDGIHVQRDLTRNAGAFAAGEHILASPAWLRVTHLDRRTRIFPVDTPQTESPPPRPPMPRTPATGFRQAAEIEVTLHAMERWKERVMPFVNGTDDTNTSIGEGFRFARVVANVAEQRGEFSYHRWIPDGSAVGWIEFVVADACTPLARIITVETERSLGEHFPPHERRKLSDARRGRAAGIAIQSDADEHVDHINTGWTARDPDGEVWRVVRAEGGPHASYACTCPDFAYKAGRAHVSCKHIWAARIAIQDAGGDTY